MKPKKREPADAGRKRNPERPPLRVMIVDDHPLMRVGLQTLIENEPDMQVCGQAESAGDAMRQVQACSPDALIVDLCLPGTSGIDLLRDLRAQAPHIPALVVSMHEERFYAERALRAGARGYVMKQDDPQRIIKGLRAVVQGDLFVSNRITRHLLHSVVGTRTPQMEGFGVNRLSDRELQVFEMIGQGKGTRRIAEELHLSVKTIETYRAHIKRKLGLENGNELILAAAQSAQSKTPG